MTILTLSTVQLPLALAQWLVDIVIIEQVCNCRIHDGETLRQIDARLPNGTPVRIMKDSYGFHVAIGNIEVCPDPVTANEVQWMLMAAVGDYCEHIMPRVAGDWICRLCMKPIRR